MHHMPGLECAHLAQIGHVFLVFKMRTSGSPEC